MPVVPVPDRGADLAPVTNTSLSVTEESPAPVLAGYLVEPDANGVIIGTISGEQGGGYLLTVPAGVTVTVTLQPDGQPIPYPGPRRLWIRENGPGVDES